LAEHDVAILSDKAYNLDTLGRGLCTTGLGNQLDYGNFPAFTDLNQQIQILVFLNLAV